MSDWSIEFYSTEKSYTYPFKDTSLDLLALNPLDILPRQTWVGMSILLLSALNLNLSFPITNK